MLPKPESYKLAEGQFFEKIEEGWFLHSPSLNIKKVYIEPTNRCNIECITCIRNSWPGILGDMDMKLFGNILSQLEQSPSVNEVILGGFGEPLLHPHILEMIEGLKKLGLKVKITTNAMLIDEELAKELVALRVDDLMVSSDGISEEKFSEIRKKGDLKNIKNNIKRLNEIKKQEKTIFPRIGIEFVMMKKNQDEIKELPSFAKELDAFCVLVTNLLPHTEEMAKEILYDSPLAPQEKPADAPMIWPSPLKSFGSMGTVDFPRMKWGAYRRCRFVERKTTVIGWDGRLAPCYSLLHSNRYLIFGREKNVTAHSFGNLNEDNLNNLWCSKEYTKFRNRVRLFMFPSCVDCNLGKTCDYPKNNEDCWGNSPSCADCLFAQDIIRCP